MGIKHGFIYFEYFAVILGGFLEFWKNFEIQDTGSKMAAVLTSWCNCHVMWRLKIDRCLHNKNAKQIKGNKRSRRELISPREHIKVLPKHCLCLRNAARQRRSGRSYENQPKSQLNLIHYEKGRASATLRSFPSFWKKNCRRIFQKNGFNNIFNHWRFSHLTNVWKFSEKCPLSKEKVLLAPGNFKRFHNR